MAPVLDIYFYLTICFLKMLMCSRRRHQDLSLETLWKKLAAAVITRETYIYSIYIYICIYNVVQKEPNPFESSIECVENPQE